MPTPPWAGLHGVLVGQPDAEHGPCRGKHARLDRGGRHEGASRVAEMALMRVQEVGRSIGGGSGVEA